jgi:hypothetical protein
VLYRVGGLIFVDFCGAHSGECLYGIHGSVDDTHTPVADYASRIAAHCSHLVYVSYTVLPQLQSAHS